MPENRCGLPDGYGPLTLRIPPADGPGKAFPLLIDELPLKLRDLSHLHHGGKKSGDSAALPAGDDFVFVHRTS